MVTLLMIHYITQVDLTEQGVTMMRNFLYEIGGLSGTYTLQSRELQCINYIKEVVGTNKVLVSKNRVFLL